MAFKQRYNEESAALGCRATNSYHQELHKLGNIELLIIDHSGLKPLNPAKRHDMMELLYRRYGHPVKVIISQLPVDQWHVEIGDTTLADANLDSLVHFVYYLEMCQPSLRKQHS